jgi:hypothetical protein
MVCFQTKNPNLGKFWSALEWKMFLYFKSIWNILHTAILFNLWPFGTVCGHLVLFPHFGMFGQRKSGNPAFNPLSDLFEKRNCEQAARISHLTHCPKN